MRRKNVFCDWIPDFLRRFFSFFLINDDFLILHRIEKFDFIKL